MAGMREGERGHGLGPSRTRVLALLQDAGRPMTVREVGERLEMPPNSVRFHLDALASGGDVVRDRERRSTPGRPSITYTAAPEAPQVAPRRYHVLARILAESLREQAGDPAAMAEQIGRRWSGSLPAAGRPDGTTTVTEALDVLTDSLGEVGFDSRAVEDGDGARIEVTHCPFLEVATDFEDVVCGVHLGLLRGVAERTDAPVRVERLEPLVEPGLCLARIAAR